MISHEIPISHSIDFFILLCVYIWCHGGRGDATCIPGGQKNHLMSLNYRRPVMGAGNRRTAGGLTAKLYFNPIYLFFY